MTSAASPVMQISPDEHVEVVTEIREDDLGRKIKVTILLPSIIYFMLIIV